MLYWVMYDISETKIRNKAVKICKNKGLYRVQKSIFLGSLNKNQKDELKIMMERIVDKDTDSIYIFPSTNFGKNRITHVGFVGKFKVNFKIPDYLGLGKSVSRGFGTIKKSYS